MTLNEMVEAMTLMERGRSYGLKPEDKKYKLVEELKRISDEAGVKPVVIGALALNHHGYLRFTADVDLLVSKEEAGKLYDRLKRELGWKRYGEGFKNTILDIGLDICVEGGRTSPRWEERFPSSADVSKVRVRPLPVVSLPDLVALKVMSGRARDEGDVVELFKIHPSKIQALTSAAKKRMRTAEARAVLDALAARAREELRR